MTHGRDKEPLWEPRWTTAAAIALMLAVLGGWAWLTW
jgi:hypothetical protein